MMSNSAPLAGTSRARRLWATSMMLAPIWPMIAETLASRPGRSSPMIRRRDDAALAHQFAGQHRGQQAGVDVAAGDHQAALLAAEPLGIGQQGGQRGRARALDHGLLDVAVKGDCRARSRAPRSAARRRSAAGRRRRSRSPTSLTAMPSAMVEAAGPRAFTPRILAVKRGEHGRLARRRCGCPACIVLAAVAMPAISPPPPIGIGRISRSGTSSSISSATVPWPAMTSQVVERVDEGQARARAQSRWRVAAASSIAVAVDHHLGAVGAGLLRPSRTACPWA